MEIHFNRTVVRNPLLKVLLAAGGLFLGLGVLVLLAVLVLPVLGLAGLVVSGALATVGLVLVLAAVALPLLVLLGLLFGLLWLPFAIARGVLRKIFCG